MVERPAIVEVGLLGLRPAAELLVDGHQVDLREVLRPLLERRGTARPVEVLAGDGRKVAGLELSQKMIDIAKIRLEKFNQQTNLFCGCSMEEV